MVPRLILKCPPPPSAESEERKPSKVLKVTLKVPPKRTCLQVAVKKDASINSGQISSRISKKESASRRKSLLKRYQEQALDSFQNDAPLSTHNNKPIPVNVFNYPEVVSRSSSDLAKLQARIEAYNAEEQYRADEGCDSFNGIYQNPCFIECLRVLVVMRRFIQIATIFYLRFCAVLTRASWPAKYSA